MIHLNHPNRRPTYSTSSCRLSSSDALDVLPFICSTSHPVDPDERQTMLLGKLGRFEGSPLDKFITTQVLGPEVKAVANWLAEQEEEISVRLRPVPLYQQSCPPYVGREGSSLLCGARGVIRSDRLLRRSNDVSLPAQWLETRDNPVSPEGVLWVVGRWGVWVDKHEGVCRI